LTYLRYALILFCCLYSVPPLRFPHFRSLTLWVSGRGPASITRVPFSWLRAAQPPLPPPFGGCPPDPLQKPSFQPPPDSVCLSRLVTSVDGYDQHVGSSHPLHPAPHLVPPLPQPGPFFTKVKWCPLKRKCRFLLQPSPGPKIFLPLTPNCFFTAHPTIGALRFAMGSRAVQFVFSFLLFFPF